MKLLESGLHTYILVCEREDVMSFNPNIQTRPLQTLLYLYTVILSVIQSTTNKIVVSPTQLSLAKPMRIETQQIIISQINKVIQLKQELGFLGCDAVRVVHQFRYFEPLSCHHPGFLLGLLNTIIKVDKDYKKNFISNIDCIYIV